MFEAAIDNYLFPFFSYIFHGSNFSVLIMKTPHYFFLVFISLFSQITQATCPTNANRFIPEAANLSEVRDTYTNLVWARCFVGSTWTGSTCARTGVSGLMHHQAALVYAAAQPGWRLPNVKEMASLVDKGCSSPSIDSNIFPITPSLEYNSYFWTSTPVSNSPEHAWVVRFWDGDVLNGDDFHGKGARRFNNYSSDGNWTRLVRDGQ